MRNYLVAPLLLLTAVWMGCANFSNWQTVHGSGNVVAEDRPVSGFDEVTVSGGGKLILAQGDEEALTIETDDNLLPLIKCEVHDGRLSIGPRNVNLRPTKSIHYQLKLKKLSDLELSGSVRVEADSIKTERLALSVSGSGNMKVAHWKPNYFLPIFLVQEARRRLAVRKHRPSASADQAVTMLLI